MRNIRQEPPLFLIQAAPFLLAFPQLLLHLDKIIRQLLKLPRPLIRLKPTGNAHGIIADRSVQRSKQPFCFSSEKPDTEESRCRIRRKEQPYSPVQRLIDPRILLDPPLRNKKYGLPLPSIPICIAAAMYAPSLRILSLEISKLLLRKFLSCAEQASPCFPQIFVQKRISVHKKLPVLPISNPGHQLPICHLSCQKPCVRIIIRNAVQLLPIRYISLRTGGCQECPRLVKQKSARSISQIPLHPQAGKVLISACSCFSQKFRRIWKRRFRPGVEGGSQNSQ